MTFSHAEFMMSSFIQVAGVHWWYNSRNHAAELAAGYYNTRERDGYLPIAAMLKRHNATLNFTCIEMRNSEQWFEAKCSPEGLVQQVLNAAWSQGVEVSCENALPRYDSAAFDQILRNARPDGVRTDGMPVRRISSFTFLRLGPDLMIEHNWNEFVRFVRQLHAGLVSCFFDDRICGWDLFLATFCKRGACFLFERLKVGSLLS